MQNKANYGEETDKVSPLHFYPASNRIISIGYCNGR
jgi:hypothetical protein